MKVELISAPGCGACVSVRRLLDELSGGDPPFVWEEIDLTVRPQVALDYGVMSCPALVIEGSVVATGNIGRKALRKILAARAGQVGVSASGELR